MAPYRNVRYSKAKKESGERNYRANREREESEGERIYRLLHEPPRTLTDYINRVAYHIETFFDQGAEIGKKIKERRKPSKLEQSFVFISFIFLGMGIISFYTPTITGNAIGMQQSSYLGAIFLIASLLSAILVMSLGKKNTKRKK